MAMTQEFPQGQPIQYYTPTQCRVSGMALTSMILGIIGLVLSIVFIGLPLMVVGLVLGIIALMRINKNPAVLGGKGFAIIGIVLGAGGPFMMILLLVILVPPLGSPPHLANQQYCAANVRGILTACTVYAIENDDVLPTVSTPVAEGTYAATFGVSSSTANVDTAIEQAHTVARGNPQAGLWMLVLRQQTSPKSLICKSDPWAGPAASPLQDGSGQYLLTPATDRQISYSLAYPWAPRRATTAGIGGGSGVTETGEWWRITTDSSLPLLSDMAPLNGTGTPSRDVTGGGATRSSGNKTWNSFNHEGEGQNVGFGDGHSEWTRTPAVGQMVGSGADNIWTVGGFPSGGRVPSAGNIGAGARPEVTPFDIIMVPLRDGTTGAVR